MNEDERSKMFQDFHDIIKSAHLSRAAVETSTPEQIVWMTADSIAENLRRYADGIDTPEENGYRWFPQSNSVVADIRRAIINSRLTEKTRTTVLGIIDRGATGWPS